MERNLDVIKKILLKIEEKGNIQPEAIEITGVQDKVINYHLHLLLDAGYIDAQVFGYGDVYPRRMTNKGHDFLDAAKNDTVWNSAKKTIRDKGVSVTLDIFKELLTSITKAALGLN